MEFSAPIERNRSEKKVQFVNTHRSRDLKEMLRYWTRPSKSLQLPSQNLDGNLSSNMINSPRDGNLDRIP